jgi:hypothetical protein
MIKIKITNNGFVGFVFINNNSLIIDRTYSVITTDSVG